MSAASTPAADAVPDVRRPRVVPRATYRLQLHREFDFAAAAAVVPYLARLGVSHLYLSPILKARAGSQHGYDVIDHTQLNPELGGDSGFATLVAAIRAHGLGIVLDVVPNHMAVFGDDNSWWLDVLENGPAARNARCFDVDWRPWRGSMRDRLLVPVLGEPLGVVIERGQIRPEFDAESGSFSLRYYEHRFPIDPREYARVLSVADRRLAARLTIDDADRQDFESLIGAFAHLPPRSDTSDDARAERYRDAEVNRRRLVRLCERSPVIREHVRTCLDTFDAGHAEGSDRTALADLLDAQAYRLSYWRVAGDEINYRRFFDVNHLAALRMHDPEVFDATHALILRLVEQGDIEGLRIDHPDGLYDPEAYFDRLQRPFRSSPDSTTPLWVVAEKILATHERLQDQWAVHGTTGYDFASVVTAWMVQGSAERVFERIYESFTGRRDTLEAIEHDSKRVVMQSSLAAEIGVLATQLDRIAQGDLKTADFTRNALREAIIEVIANFPVYRTYVSSRGVSDDDRRHVEWAVNVARKRGGSGDVSVFDFLRDVLLGDAARGRSEDDRLAMFEFVMKFQQVTSPVMAKSVEDTAFYVYNRLVALNEVGHSPARFGASTAALHQANLERARRWPYAMLLSSTHDTKRSGDVRARLAVLTEMPAEWRKRISRWSRLNRAKRALVDGRPAPSRNDEYLLYQTLLGIWPLEQREDALPDQIEARLREYAVKAAREAKLETSWMNPNGAYEEGMAAFISRLFERPPLSAFLKDFRGFADVVAYFGVMNSLAQTALRLTAPGIPDLYQGTELPDFSLVDPDNRRPVDYAIRNSLLADFETLIGVPGDAHLQSMLASWRDGRLKQYLTWRLLRLRAERPGIFAGDDYQPLKVTGAHADHLCAFTRCAEDGEIAVVVPRWFSTLTNGPARAPIGLEVWRDTSIEWSSAHEPRSYRELFTGVTITPDRATRCVDAAEVLARFPIAVLIR